MTEQEFNRIFKRSNELWETDFFQKHGTAAIEKHTANCRDQFACDLHGHMRNLESPLEAAFLAWWMVVSHRREDIGIDWQQEVAANGTTYRLDFVIEPTKYGFLEGLIGAPDCPRIAVELDGHEFHEKTKAQVTYRNRRDRELQAAGWIVLHVSGSEFNADPEKVVAEVYERASDMIYAAYRKRRQ